MVPGRFSWFFMVPGWFFTVFMGPGWFFIFHVQNALKLYSASRNEKLEVESVCLKPGCCCIQFVAKISQILSPGKISSRTETAAGSVKSEKTGPLVALCFHW